MAWNLTTCSANIDKSHGSQGMHTTMTSLSQQGRASWRLCQLIRGSIQSSWRSLGCSAEVKLATEYTHWEKVMLSSIYLRNFGHKVIGHICMSSRRRHCWSQPWLDERWDKSTDSLKRINFTTCGPSDPADRKCKMGNRCFGWLKGSL